MKYVIEKTITKRYEVTHIWNFLKYGTFVSGRKGMSNTPTTCFRCGRKFTEDDDLYLGVVNGDKNRVFCSSCGEHIASILNMKKQEN